jgi:hypothetical protein
LRKQRSRMDESAASVDAERRAAQMQIAQLERALVPVCLLLSVSPL